MEEALPRVKGRVGSQGALPETRLDGASASNFDEMQVMEAQEAGPLRDEASRPTLGELPSHAPSHARHWLCLGG